MPLKVLFIDDEPDNVIPAKEEVETALPGTETAVVSFEESTSAIENMQPDVIVLDLMKNEAGGLQVNAGGDIGLTIWNQRFCPLIYYTASHEGGAEVKHPLIAVIRKGSGSEEQVREQVREYIPHIAALGTVTNEINTSLRRALRESRPHVFKLETPRETNDLLVRTIRRRVAASMDDAMAEGTPNMMSWEQYLAPPSIDHLLTGDIVRSRNSDKDDPASYVVILTPSCDLVQTATRNPKVSAVLVARCTSVGRLLIDIDVRLKQSANNSSARDKIAKFLTQGYGHSSFPIASLPGEFPVIAADFRALEVLPIAELQNKDVYERVASVDAPFRELFVWAYLSAAGRPGMPDRDFGPWADAIISEVQKAAATPAPAGVAE